MLLKSRRAYCGGSPWFLGFVTLFAFALSTFFMYDLDDLEKGSDEVRIKRPQDSIKRVANNNGVGGAAAGAAGGAVAHGGARPGPAAAQEARPSPSAWLSLSSVTGGGGSGYSGGVPSKVERPKPSSGVAVRSTARDPVGEVPYKFKIYIYEDVPRVLNENLRVRGTCKGGYAAAEVLIPDLIARSSVYTPHAELADFYLVPILADCYLHDKLNRGVNFVQAVGLLNRAVTHALDIIQAKFPYWSRTEGRDHIFVLPTERGASAMSEPNLLRIRKSLFLTGVLARDSHAFDSWKDIVIPPAVDVGMPEEAGGEGEGEGSGDGGERPTLLHFRGVVPGRGDRAAYGVRNQLQLSLEGREGVQFEGNPDASACARECMLAEMRRSQFCLVPSGVEGWSLGLIDALAAGCVPVIVADTAELPFEGEIDYTTFTVKAPESEQGNGDAIMKRLSPARAAVKRATLEKVRGSLVYHDRWQAGDAFDLLLRQLHTRLRYHRNSPYRFYATLEENG